MKERKWFYETVFGGLPLLSSAEPTEATVLFLLFFELLALLLAPLLKLSITTILWGTLVLFMIALWTMVASYIGPSIRALGLPKRAPEGRIMEKYRDLLFSRWRVELLIALVIFASLTAYFVYNDWVIFKNLSNGGTSGVFLAFGLFLTWEICYRVSLSLWASLLAAWRSIGLYKVSRGKGREWQYFPYKEIERLNRLDRLNLSFALTAIPLYLVSGVDPPLRTLATLYFAVMLTFYVVSAIGLRLTVSLPRKIETLLSEAKFGMLGVVDPEKQAPHVTPMTFVHDPFRIYVVTSTTSKKLRTIRKNPKVCFLVDLREKRSVLAQKAVLIEGTANVLGFLEAFRRGFKMFWIRREFVKKYPLYVRRYRDEQDRLPLAWQLRPFISRLAVEIEIDRMVYWEGAGPWVRV